MEDTNIIFTVPDEANLQLASPDLVNYYNDLKERIYWISGEIGKDCFDLIQYIIRWNREDKNLPIEARKPIKIFFASPGGDLDVEETLVSMIKLSKTPIYGFALGLVASAASLIFLATHKKYALTNAYFLLHRGSCHNISGDFTNVQNAMADYRKQIEKLEAFYTENTRIPLEIIKEKLDSDWYIRGEELLQYGLIDEWISNIDILL